MAELHEQRERAPTSRSVEFRGKGAEYFRIWIVNIALSVATLGVFSAWAKVRAQRYFYGNTFLDGHSFEYHASAWRILIGRAIALTLFLGYSMTVVLFPISFALWILIFAAAIPWLANSSIRFNARNTSWRNVRFDFSATYFEAFIAYVVWSTAALVMPFLIPYTRRVHDYFFVNHHRFGRRAFSTSFSAGRIYVIYLLGFTVIVVLLVAVISASAGLVVLATRAHNLFGRFSIPIGSENFSLAFFALFGLGAAFVTNYVTTLVTNLTISHTILEGGFRLSARASGLRVAWIAVTNALLTLATLGLYYPFGRVRLARYRMGKYMLIANGDLDGFTAEALEAQNAVGQEIAGFFDLGFGL